MDTTGRPGSWSLASEQEQRWRTSRLEGIATEAAHAGAVEVVGRIDRATNIGYKSGATDPLTDACRASERAIIAVLPRAWLDDGLAGEEGSSSVGASGLRLVIGPLDEPVNYLYGMPNIAVNVAYERLVDGVWWPVAGAVHDISRRETFSAAQGLGACLNGTAIAVNLTKDLSMALIATGFSYSAESRTRQSRVLNGVLPSVRYVRSSNGSAALELCWVACGRYDAHYEDESGAWDTAAGRGNRRRGRGHVTALGTGGVIVFGPALHNALTYLLESAAGDGRVRQPSGETGCAW